MKNLLAFLFSTKLMALLFVTLSVAMGVATFIENDFGTQTAKALVYNSWWFEAILGFFCGQFLWKHFSVPFVQKRESSGSIISPVFFVCFDWGSNYALYQLRRHHAH